MDLDFTDSELALQTKPMLFLDKTAWTIIP